tara:strand:- start:896 stop:1033 length:138 start_codon:yes stop_codon:yes gene_type:complete
MIDTELKIDDAYDYLVPSYFQIGECEIIILQSPEGDAITIKVRYD